MYRNPDYLSTLPLASYHSPARGRNVSKESLSYSSLLSMLLTRSGPALQLLLFFSFSNNTRTVGASLSSLRNAEKCKCGSGEKPSQFLKVGNEIISYVF